MTRSLVVAGNFNLTNTEELFQRLVNIGQHPKDRSDTVTVLEKIGHYLDKTTIRMEEECIAGGMTRREAEAYIAKNLDVMEILRNACEHWDGGYVIAGLIGHGDSFVLRDPAGIRPAFYYVDDEVAVVTSERPVIQTTFNIQDESLIHELPPGHEPMPISTRNARNSASISPRKSSAQSMKIWRTLFSPSSRIRRKSATTVSWMRSASIA